MQTGPATPIERLPQEIFQYIFTYLDFKDRQNVALVNKLWCKLEADPLFWQGQVQQFFPYIRIAYKPATPVNYKQIFINEYERLAKDDEIVGEDQSCKPYLLAAMKG